jgi:hypothetical protein
MMMTPEEHGKQLADLVRCLKGENAREQARYAQTTKVGFYSCDALAGAKPASRRLRRS